MNQKPLLCGFGLLVIGALSVLVLIQSAVIPQARERPKPKTVHNNPHAGLDKKRWMESDSSANFRGIQDVLSTIDCNNNSSYNNHVTQTLTYSFLSEYAILQRTSHCDSYFRTIDIFGQELSAARLSLSSESPLAFSHSIHQQAGILEVFLALTFRPGDSHCFHIDPKASDATTKAMESIISCYNQKYPNTTMFVIPHPVPVYWGHFSVLESDLLCIRELLKRDSEWKFYMNPASSELPLITIEEMEKILWSLKRSVIDSYYSIHFEARHKYQQVWKRGPDRFERKHETTNILHPPPPLNLTIRKGSKNVALNRVKAKSMINDQLAISLQDWLQDTSFPDEHFYSTLASVKSYNFMVCPWQHCIFQKGTVKQDLSCNCTEWGCCIPFACIRKSMWFDAGQKTECKGKVSENHVNVAFGPTFLRLARHFSRTLCFTIEPDSVDVSLHRQICHLSTEDLPKFREDAAASKCFMANKFDLHIDSVAVLCQAKDIVQKTRDILGRNEISSTINSVTNHISTDYDK